MPYASKEARKEAGKKWYQKNKEKHKARTQARYYANHEENKKKQAARIKAHRALYGRKEYWWTFLSDQERLHIYKPLQRWLENPRLSKTVPELVLEAEQKWHQREKRREERKIEILTYNREKSRRRKARLKSATYAKIKPKQLRQRFDDFDGCCAYCGKKLEWGARDCHIEHILPLSKGGGHVLSNIVYACKTCNFNKHNHDAEQWYKSKPFFSQKRWNRILAVMGVKGKNFGQLSLL